LAHEGVLFAGGTDVDAPPPPDADDAAVATLGRGRAGVAGYWSSKSTHLTW
jgi:hypothetical protein